MGLVNILLTILVSAPAPSADDQRLAEAQRFFEGYQQLLTAFDPRVIDQYSDDARIVNIRKDALGQPIRTLEITGKQYKELARRAMTLARERGDISEYSEVTYALEGERVRIRATRYSVLKDYESLYSALAGPSENGTWLIFEELSESQPQVGSPPVPRPVRLSPRDPASNQSEQGKTGR